MGFVGRTSPVVAVLLAALATATPNCGLAQQVVLTAGVGKTTFFEDEPIYLLVRSQNIGTDTAWVSFFNLVSPALTLVVSRGHGTPVPVPKPIESRVVRPSWRGEPFPPGASDLNTIVLQDIMGDEQDIANHLFAHHLSPDEYELRVEFDAHLGVPRTTPLKVAAAPIVFRIRERTPAEESEVRELEAMRQMGWDTTRVAGYPRAAAYKSVLIHWVARRLGGQPDDPFLPFLLYNGLYGVGQILARQIQEGTVSRFDPDTSEVVSRLRLAVIERHKLSTAGAHLVQALSARHPDRLVVLAEQLKGTPAGEMARYHVERSRHGQQFKKQSLRQRGRSGSSMCHWGATTQIPPLSVRHRGDSFRLVRFVKRIVPIFRDLP